MSRKYFYIIISTILIFPLINFIYSNNWLFGRNVSHTTNDLEHNIYLPIISYHFINPDAGNVRFFKHANSSFDPYTNSPDSVLQSWMREHYWCMLTYSPYFDDRLSWYPNAWTYKDLYAVYINGQGGHDYLLKYHPEWILKDEVGNYLFINLGCDGQSCPQYAADVGNPSFREWWINDIRKTFSANYLGIWIDDVNMIWRISNGSGEFIQPIDPRTGMIMTLEDWRRYIAEFTEQIRVSFPAKEIIHNIIWYAGPNNNTYIIREILAADYINFERGVNDDGLVGGNGQWGLETFLSFVDFVHNNNRNVLFLTNKESLIEREYGLAGWLLISEGLDGFSNELVSNPDNWWNGYQLILGSGLGKRYEWEGVLRRDFRGGIVLLNKPDNPTRNLIFNQPYVRIDGSVISSIELNASTAAILMVP